MTCTYVYRTRHTPVAMLSQTQGYLYEVDIITELKQIKGIQT